jgi:signal transduction histidine kinase
MVDTDKKLVRNVLINLVSNAVKFSPDESNIRVDSHVEKRMSTISVQDEGIGISAEDQEHLFISFFRGKNALNIQGTGLGLHIVKRYIDLLEGKVEIHSELGKGTTIQFSIPIKHS